MGESVWTRKDSPAKGQRKGLRNTKRGGVGEKRTKKPPLLEFLNLRICGEVLTGRKKERSEGQLNRILKGKRDKDH